MAYDEGLAPRNRDRPTARDDEEEKGMFGGLGFMVSQHMACGIVGETLMSRLHAAEKTKGESWKLLSLNS